MLTFTLTGGLPVEPAPPLSSLEPDGATLLFRRAPLCILDRESLLLDGDRDCVI